MLTTKSGPIVVVDTAESATTSFVGTSVDARDTPIVDTLGEVENVN